MKRLFTQTATKTITLSREIVVEFPADIHPNAIDPKALDTFLERANVDWHIDDEEIEVDHSEWSDAGDDARAALIYSDIYLEALDALYAPTEIDMLFQAAAELKPLGFVEDAKRIRRSIRTLVRQLRRKWLQSSNYFPWDDEEWVWSSDSIPEELEDHPAFLNGVAAILRDVELVRQGAISEQVDPSAAGEPTDSSHK